MKDEKVKYIPHICIMGLLTETYLPESPVMVVTLLYGNVLDILRGNIPHSTGIGFNSSSLLHRQVLAFKN